MQPSSLSLDRSFTFSRDEAPLRLPNLPCSADLRPSAVGSASGRAGAYDATTGASLFRAWPRRVGPTISPAKPRRPSLRTLRPRRRRSRTRVTRTRAAEPPVSRERVEANRGTGSEADSVAVGVNDDVEAVIVVERLGRAVEYSGPTGSSPPNVHSPLRQGRCVLCMGTPCDGTRAKRRTTH
jgi:hypothetical protein